MKKNLTEVVFILDKSGSMYPLLKDTVGGYNSLLKKQKAEEGEAYISTILFNDKSSVIHDRVPVKDTKPMTFEEYCPGGCTALLDAVGDAIKHIGNIHKYARKEDVPEKTLFVITTDGMENASCRYDYKDIKKMIEKQKSKYGWEFLFLGANIDSALIGGRMGISEEFTTDYICDNEGVKLNFNVLSNAICRMRSKKSIFGADWKKDIDRDRANRKK